MSSRPFFSLLLLPLVLAACATPTPTPPPNPNTVQPEAVVAEGHLMPKDDMYLTFAVRGKVAEVLVEKGANVTAGQVLARLGDREGAAATLAGAELEQAAAALELAAAELEQTNAQQAYDTITRTASLTHAQAVVKFTEAQTARAAAERTWEALDLDALDDDIEVADAEVESRKADLEDAQDEFNKYRNLSKDNPTRKTAEDALEVAQENYNEAVRKQEALEQRRDLAEAALASARAAEAEARRLMETTALGATSDAQQLAALRLNTAEQRLATAQLRVTAAAAQLAAAKRNLANYDLTAPFDGVVTDINVSAGESVGTDKWVVQVADFSAWYVETSDLNELEVVKITEGQSVILVPDAFSEEPERLELQGTVESIALVSKLQSGDVVYTVKIRLNDPDARLRWGMTFEVEFVP